MTNDHDMIIRIDQKMTGMCDVVNKIDTKVGKLDEKVDKIQAEGVCQYKDCSKTFVNRKIWMWITGFIVAGVIAVASYAQLNHDAIVQHEAQPTHSEKPIQR